jgi:hypothetical protein
MAPNNNLMVGRMLMSVAFAMTIATTTLGQSFAQVGEENKITVLTDSSQYWSPQSIIISGEVANEIFDPDMQIRLEIYDPSKDLYKSEELTVGENESYEYELAGRELQLVGTYMIRAVYGTDEAETTFQFNGSSFPDEPCALEYCSYGLNINGSSYPIRYKTSANVVKNMELDLPSKAVLIFLEKSEYAIGGGGYIRLELPRDIIDARQQNGNQQANFLVSAGPSQDLLIPTDYIESAASSSNRMVIINLAEDATVVEIVGTVVMPEFNGIPALILGLSVAVTVGFPLIFRKKITIGL